MNPRRVHQLMLDRFPAFDTVDFDWENMHDGKAPLLKELSELLVRYIEAPEVLVEVHRKLGALLPIDEAVAFIGSHIGEGQIRVADRQFTSFVVVALNGVAAGWRMTDNGSLGTDMQLKATAKPAFKLKDASVSGGEMLISDPRKWQQQEDAHLVAKLR